MTRSFLRRLLDRIRQRPVQRAGLALLLASGASLVLSFASAKQRSARATARLDSAAEQLDLLTGPGDDSRRAAIAWGYAERLRLGLESPFRLIDAAGRDPRLTIDERRTVSWALMAHVLRGQTHQIDPAALDGLGPNDGRKSVAGEQHVALIEAAVLRADNPRAAELAVRLAYTLAVEERLIDASATLLAAEAAAMIADREVARREANALVRSAVREDPVEAVSRRRAARSFYVERRALLTPTDEIERETIGLVAPLLDSLRAMSPTAPLEEDGTDGIDSSAVHLAPRLYAAGGQAPPSGALAVTVQRYLPMIRARTSSLDTDALARARNAEMLVAAVRAREGGGVGRAVQRRVERRSISRLLLAAGVAARSQAQEPVWFPPPADSMPSASRVASSLGVARIVFDHDVPAEWQPYFLRSLADGVRDLRRVLPSLRLDALQVRFRMQAPADSALAMHDPRSRTLHLPVLSAGGTLSHELAHDLDRQSAQQLGLAGYRSDIVGRTARGRSTRGAGSRLGASLRALTEELSQTPRRARASAERPAEVFATQVDWFVASALAREGISSGFLSAVQDELLTGHVVHPERLRASGRSRSLLTALEEMTSVAASAAEPYDPSLQTLLRWSLVGPVDRRVASEILNDGEPGWTPPSLFGNRSCDRDVQGDGRVALVRMAAESRARGWLRLRARWMSDAERPAWARAMLREGPWVPAGAERRVAELRDYILVELASTSKLPAGLGAYGAGLATQARCSE